MASDITAPARFAANPTLDTDLTPFRSIYVGAAGNVSVRMTDQSNDVTFVGVLAGTIIPVQGKRINSANTTVASPTTNILVLW